jgi:predicted ATPase
MPITRIEVSNFKSFEKLDVSLKGYNVLVGANASGKSNFVSVFKFLKDIADSGLDNAISMQGGVEYVRNMRIGGSQYLSIKIHASPERPEPVPYYFDLTLVVKGRRTSVAARVAEYTYAFSIAFGKKRGFKVVNETLTVRFEEQEKGGSVEKDAIPRQQLSVTVTREGRRLRVEPEPSNMHIPEYEILPSYLYRGKRRDKLRTQLLIESPYSLVLSLLSRLFKNVAIFDLDPRFSKRSTVITGKTELEPDGSNLAIALKHILDSSKDREEMLALAKDLLPFVDRFKVQKLADKSLLATMRETYSEVYLPATLVSDGTINVTALLVALYFEKKSIIVVEEPEKNIHPYLASKIVAMMKDVSDRFDKQLIITTHSPDIVKYSGVDTLLLISRGEEGFSHISRPAEKEEVRTFLQHDMGVEELYIQNLLD